MKVNHLKHSLSEHYLTILRDEIEQGQPINIYSDSSYSIRCCTSYGEKMLKKGWKVLRIRECKLKDNLNGLLPGLLKQFNYLKMI